MDDPPPSTDAGRGLATAHASTRTGPANGPANGHGSGHGTKAEPPASVTSAASVVSVASVASESEATHTPKKRRKVNHACVYCRRSHMTCDLERPCTRCVKRNIGHLCHDEPRDSDSRKSKSVVGGSVDESDDFDPRRDKRTHSHSQGHTGRSGHAGPNRGSHHQLGNVNSSNAVGAANTVNTVMRPPFDATRNASKPFNAGVLGQPDPLHLVRPTAVSGIKPNNALGNDVSQLAGFSDAWLSAQNHFDMHNHNGYMIVPEVSGELQFLNDFLHSSMVDDAAFVDDQNAQLLRSAPPDVATSFLTSPTNGVKTGGGSGGGSGNNDKSISLGGDLHADGLLSSNALGSMFPPGIGSTDAAANGGRPRTPLRTGVSANSGTTATDKTRDYYLTAADPQGNDTPEHRMSDLLKAKYDAGLLKPFNYVKGYAALHTYLDSHKIAPASKQRIQRQLDRFRPKFREKMQALTDLELIYVEMWFERTLMEYDRVFASMAVPACCWRRTGEIFRGNKEMAELIKVPVEKLRDGKIAIHEILTEESVVRYWEEFGTIAFDTQHDTLLTACSIKRLDDSEDTVIKCCFSLKIRRDDHKIPSLIVGNFLPHDPLIQ